MTTRKEIKAGARHQLTAKSYSHKPLKGTYVLLLLCAYGLAPAVRPQDSSESGPPRIGEAAQKKDLTRADRRIVDHNGKHGSYAGDDACRPCHAEIFENYRQTAHFLTSQEPNSRSVSGTFSDGENVLKTRNPQLLFRMDAKQDGMYETAV